MSFDVITMGSSTVDVFARTSATDEQVIDIRSGERQVELMAYPLGSKILIERLDSYAGGGGTNTAVAFARLGLTAGYVGKLGKDVNGLDVVRTLRKEGVEFLGAVGQRTGFSFVLNSQAHDRTVFTFRGCNDDLRFEELRLDRLEARWLYSSSLIGESFTTLARVARLMKAKGTKVALNPSAYLAKKGVQYLQPALPLLDLLVLNKEEAQLLVGSGDEGFLLRKLKALVPGMVIVTDGARGSWALASGQVLYLAPRPVEVVESTGAGDAFAAT
ncbi:MAG: carbohydrate kinase family protein, partial [Nitrosarchaeum sp.]|nr:carbohydrate kinase family protein [Nitrosarchaeum sp.]